MVVKVFISLTSGLKEVKKRQQKILMILDSKNIKYEVLDISEPGKEEDKDFMHTNSTANGGTASDPNPRHPLPPQLFNDKEYCGDYDQFELANEIDNLEVFLKLSPEEIPQLNKSTLDASKIDENHPNGKVIEDDEPETAAADEDKENKTEDDNNQGNVETQEKIEEKVEEKLDNYSELADEMLENAGEGENDDESPIEETVTQEKAADVESSPSEVKSSDETSQPPDESQENLDATKTETVEIPSDGKNVDEPLDGQKSSDEQLPDNESQEATEKLDETKIETVELSNESKSDEHQETNLDEPQETKTEDQPALSDDQPAPLEEQLATSEDKTAPSDDQPAPLEDKSAKSEDQPVPSEDQNKPSEPQKEVEEEIKQEKSSELESSVPAPAATQIEDEKETAETEIAEEFGDDVVVDEVNQKSADSIQEEPEEEELEIEEQHKDSLESVPQPETEVPAKELTESEKLIQSEQETQ